MKLHFKNLSVILTVLILVANVIAFNTFKSFSPTSVETEIAGNRDEDVAVIL